MGAAAIPILGSVAGAVASKAMSGGGGSGGTTTTNEPWSGLQPYLGQLYEGASNLLKGSEGGFQYYPGSTLAEQSPYTQLAQQSLADRIGTAGIFGQGYGPSSDLTQQLLSQFNPSLFGLSDIGYGGQGPSSTFPGQASMSSLMPTAMGQMLNSNPYLDQMFNGAASQVTGQFRYGTMPGLESMFSKAGRYGPGAAMTNQVDLANQGLGSTLGRLAGNIYGQNYANERSNQMNAAQQLGAFGTADVESQLRALQGLPTGAQYDTQNQMAMLQTLLGNTNVDINQLMGLGGQQESRNQALIDADKARWDYVTRQSSYEPLQQFASLIGQIGVPSSSSMQYNPNTASTLFGGAQMGNALAKQLFPAMGAPTFGGTPFNYGLNSFQGSQDYGFGGGNLTGFGQSSLFGGY